MTEKQFISLAIKGGWKPYPDEYTKKPMEVEIVSYDEFFDMGLGEENWADDMIKLTWDDEGDGYPIGGGEYAVLGYPLHESLLEPKAWQAVGKVIGWKDRYITSTTYYLKKTGKKKELLSCEWQYKMHAMIDALAEGRSITEFLATL